jgi:hypothetical protein
MTFKNLFFLILSMMSLSVFAQKPAKQVLHYKQEKHLKKIKQLTFGGDNAEVYWSFDNKSLVFQSNNPAWGIPCDQIFVMFAMSKSRIKMECVRHLRWLALEKEGLLVLILCLTISQ